MFWAHAIKYDIDAQNRDVSRVYVCSFEMNNIRMMRAWIFIAKQARANFTFWYDDSQNVKFKWKSSENHEHQIVNSHLTGLTQPRGRTLTDRLFIIVEKSERSEIWNPRDCVNYR